MITLGLQCGHDGSVCILKDGKIVSFVSRERHARVKHAIGVTAGEIDLALRQAGLSTSDIDRIAFVSTQNMEILDGLMDGLDIALTRHPDDHVPSALAEALERDSLRIQDRLSFSLGDLLRAADESSLQYKMYSKMLPERDAVKSNAVRATGWLDHYIAADVWLKGRCLSEIAASNVADLLTSREIHFGFHYPVTVKWKGRAIPATFVNHHVAHAASSFFRSGFADAMIITHDGFSSGQGYHSGLILFASGNRILPLSPHHLDIGAVYDHVGLSLNLGEIGPAGKLMGLAPYGKPAFFDKRFVGNAFGVKDRVKAPSVPAWFKHCVKTAAAMGYDMTALGVKDRITEPVNVDIAASTQKLFEETYLKTVRTAHALMTNSGIATPRLCLSGGTALNCPSNSRIFNEGPFKELFIEPHCGDDGLAVGAALYVHHHLLGHPPLPPATPYATPYLSASYSGAEIEQALSRHADVVDVETVPSGAASAAKDLHDDKVIAWFEGGGEAGPRALGHRSVLANPTHAANWGRVNEIKERERWRPFAPSVLAEEAGKWFSGLPKQSPYMLFTGQVTADNVPAIRHVDGSARIQTVDPSVGEYYDLIKAFFALSGVPLVLNTSLNGPREPIVETADEAIALLARTKLDALYIGNRRITRKSRG